MKPRPPHLTFGPYAFDPTSRVLLRAGQELPLPPRVVGVLEVLLTRAGDVVPRQELIESVWKDAFVTDTSLAEAVSALRQALGDDAQAPTYVQTLHRRGYRFVAPVGEAALEQAKSTARAPSAANADGAPVRPSIAGELVPWSVATLCAIVAVAAVWQFVKGRQAAEPPVVRFPISLAEGTRLDGRAPALALSPDASTVAWSGCDSAGCRLYTRRLDRMQPQAVPGTEGASAPFFAPDGQSLGFFADGQLKRVSLSGGAPIRLIDAPDVRGAVWTPGGEIIYAGSALGGLTRIAAGGGEPHPLTNPRAADGEVGHAWPVLMPSSAGVLFTVLHDRHVGIGRLAALASEDFRRSDGWRVLVGGIGRPAAATADALLFSRGDELQAMYYDRSRLSIAGSSSTVTSALAPSIAGPHAAVSGSGALLIADAPASAMPQFAWSADGREEPLAMPDRILDAVALSSDGTRLAGTETTDGTTADIWIADLGRGTTSRVTTGAHAAGPVWGGDSLFYAARERGAYDIWRKDTDLPTTTAAPHPFVAPAQLPGGGLAGWIGARVPAARRHDGHGPVAPPAQRRFAEPAGADTLRGRRRDVLQRRALHRVPEHRGRSLGRLRPPPRRWQACGHLAGRRRPPVLVAGRQCALLPGEPGRAAGDRRVACGRAADRPRRFASPRRATAT